MSDIICRICQEPWDAYGVRNGDMTKSEAKKFLAGEGCPACGFGKWCLDCSGTGRYEAKDYWGWKLAHDPKSPDYCEACMGQRHLFIRGPLHTCPDFWKPDGQVFTYDYQPNVKAITLTEADLKSIQMRAPEEQYCFEGKYYSVMVKCPVCKDKGEPCPTCGGTGKRDPKKESEESKLERLDEFMHSLCDSSDEDPILLIGRINL